MLQPFATKLLNITLYQVGWFCCVLGGAWGYPVIPGLFILASAGILLNTLIERPFEALAGIGLTALGIPVYRLWRRRNT